MTDTLQCVPRPEHAYMATRLADGYQAILLTTPLVFRRDEPESGQQRRYTDGQKRAAVMLAGSGVSVAEAARRLGVATDSIFRWRDQGYGEAL